jgi:hypothetical protein
MIFILLLFIHMKMKKMLIGAFLGIFAVAGIAVLPNVADAANAAVNNYKDSDWANPNAEGNYLSSTDTDQQKLT